MASMHAHRSVSAAKWQACMRTEVCHQRWQACAQKWACKRWASSSTSPSSPHMAQRMPVSATPTTPALYGHAANTPATVLHCYHAEQLLQSSMGGTAPAFCKAHWHSVALHSGRPSGSQPCCESCTPLGAAFAGAGVMSCIRADAAGMPHSSS
jgi:hypothetical protein